MTRRGSQLRLHAAALAGYVALALFLTWPLATVLGSPQVVGGQGVRFTFQDASQNVWNLWWVRRALAEGLNPFWTPLLYYPDGVQMYLQTLNISNGLLTLPVNLAAGPIVAFQAAVLLGVALTGYGGFLLARHFVPRAWVAWVAGALLTAGPFHVLTLENNQLQLIAMQWVPLYLLALLRLDGLPGDGTPWPVPRAEWAAVGWTVAAAAMVVLTDWYWVLLCGVFTAVWALTGLAASPRRLVLLRRYALAGLGAVVALAPLLAGILAVRRELPQIDPLADPVWRNYIHGFSADALGLLLPPPFHPALAPLAPFGREGYGPEGWYVGAGWATLVAAALGLARAWRAHWRLLAAGAACWAMSLGPTLWIAGVHTGVSMPYSWLQSLPFLGVGRRPALFAAMAIVVAVVFAGIGLQGVLDRWGRRGVALLILPVLGLAAFEAWPPPRALFAFEEPPVYNTIAAAPGAVADLPILYRFEDGRTLRNQLVHGQPILDGYVARWPAPRSLGSNLWLRQLAFMRLEDADIVPTGQSALAALQCAAPVRHVVIDTTMATAEQRRNVELLLARLAGAPLAPTYEDATHVAFELPAFADRCGPIVALGAGWHDREADADGRIWRWSGEASELIVTNTGGERQTFELSFVAAAYKTPRRVELWTDGRKLGTWEVGLHERRYRLVLDLPRTTTLTFKAPAVREDRSHSSRSLSIVVQDVTVRPFP